MHVACSYIQIQSHTRSIHHDARSFASCGYELHSHRVTQPNHSSLLKLNTVFYYFHPSHMLRCVKDSYSRTHIVSNSSHKANIPWYVWFSFYLFKSYHHHMGGIFQNTVSLSTYAGSPLSWPSDPFPGFLSSPDLIFLPSAGAELIYKVAFSYFWWHHVSKIEQNHYI